MSIDELFLLLMIVLIGISMVGFIIVWIIYSGCDE